MPGKMLEEADQDGNEHARNVVDCQAVLVDLIWLDVRKAPSRGDRVYSGDEVVGGVTEEDEQAIFDGVCAVLHNRTDRGGNWIGQNLASFFFKYIFVYLINGHA